MNTNPNVQHDRRGISPFMLLIVGASVAILYFLSPILVPLSIAIILLAVFDPLFDKLRAKRVPQWVGVALSFVALAVVIYALGAILFIGAYGIVERWPFYVDRFRGIVSSLIENANLDPALFDLQDIVKNATGTALGIGNWVMGFAGNAFVVLLLFAFAAFEKPKLVDAVAKALPGSHMIDIVRQTDEMFEHVSRFFAVKVLLSGAHGLVCYLVLRLLNVDFSELWAVFAFALYMIPVFGTPLVSALAAVVCVLQYYPDVSGAIVVLVAINASGTVIGSIIDPKISGHELDVSALLGLISLLFWGWIWGPVGAILAIPLTALFRIICLNVESLRPIGVLMGPAPSRAEASGGANAGGANAGGANAGGANAGGANAGGAKTGGANAGGAKAETGRKNAATKKRGE